MKRILPLLIFAALLVLAERLARLKRRYIDGTIYPFTCATKASRWAYALLAKESYVCSCLHIMS